jgi:hypothetical protein
MRFKRKNSLKNYLLLILPLILFILAACSGAAEPEASYAPAQEVSEEPASEEVFVEAEAVQQDAIEGEAPQAAAEGDSAQPDTIAPVTNRPNVYNRLIIKNAEVEMIVEDTDTAINRSLGIVMEYNGYVVSNRTWFSGEDKHATLTLGVPSENFEEMMRRLKDLAVTVSNETVSGQDVTDEFVDLKSRLVNLEATADRIREFLDQAKTVEESLKVNQQLSTIEADIEQVKGRMAYLKDRAAFSTITLQISPQVIVPEPTPSPTPTPEPWSAGRTFNQATGVTSKAAFTLFTTAIDLTIWFAVVVLPFALPLFLFAWFIFRWVRRSVAGNVLHPPSS